MDDDSRTPLEEPEEEELTLDDLIRRGLKQMQDKVIAAERAYASEMAKREIVLNMTKEGFLIEQIARAVDSDEVVVESWLAEME